MSDLPQRTNEYAAKAVSKRYKQCLFEWLAAHTPLWNQLTYRRRQAYFSENGDVWEAEYTDLYDSYAPILGKAACQQIARKNSEAWCSFFKLLDTYRSDDPSVTDKPSPPSYWGNRDDGYKLHGLVRNDLYEFDWYENRSTLEFGVGDVLEEKYDFAHNERVTIEVRGNPQWDGDDSRLKLIYDETTDVLRVTYPIRIQPESLEQQRLADFTQTLDPENTTHTAAVDVGANNTLALVTNTGEIMVYHARPEFERFQQYTQRIASLQSALAEGSYSSHQIRRLYAKRTRKRDHSRNAAIKHAAEWLLEQNVDSVYVGDLSDVLDSHWSATVNEKTHSFWSHGQLTDRLKLTLGDVGISVTEVSEAGSSSECPECNSRHIQRNGDEFRCTVCGLEAHSDVVGAWNLLQEEVGSMARPAALRAERRRDVPRSSIGEGAYWEWNEHDWILDDCEELSRSCDQTNVSKPVSSQPR